jgi:hypothetical protein
MNSKEILDREFLEIRAKILEVGAALDRIDRAAGDVSKEPRLGLIEEAIQILSVGDLHRAERIQLLFSREYDDNWQDKFELTSRT